MLKYQMVVGLFVINHRWTRMNADYFLFNAAEKAGLRK